MAEIDTGCLEQILLDTGAAGLSSYESQHLSQVGNMTFGEYFQSILSEHAVTRAEAIAGSGLEVHYAYQILNGRKHPTRDKLLCLCIGGGLTLRETDRALARASVGKLYPKRMRDAVIMIALNEGIRTVWQVNELLAAQDQELLA